MLDQICNKGNLKRQPFLRMCNLVSFKPKPAFLLISLVLSTLFLSPYTPCGSSPFPDDRWYPHKPPVTFPADKSNLDGKMWVRFIYDLIIRLCASCSSQMSTFVWLDHIWSRNTGQCLDQPDRCPDEIWTNDISSLFLNESKGWVFFIRMFFCAKWHCQGVC